MVPRSNLTHRFILAAGVTISGAGLIVLIGWQIHSVPMIQIFPTLAPMQRMTALGFLLSGIALVLACTGRRHLAALSALAVFLEAALVLLEYALDLRLGIDEFLGHDYIVHVRNPFPGRMSPMTAICFLSSSFALIVASVRGLAPYAAAIAGTIASVLIAVGIVSFLGFVSGYTETYVWSQFARMALHTSAAFSLFGTAILALAWMKGRVGQGAPDWLPLSLGLGLAAGILGVWQALMASKASELPLLSGIILAGGLAVALLASIAVAQAQQALKRNRDLQESNRMLHQLITELQRAQEALGLSEERFRSIFEQGPIGIALVGADHRFIEVNSAFRRMLGYSEEEFTGMTPLDITHPDDRESSAILMEGLFKSGIPVCKTEKRYLKRNGEILWASLTASAIRDRNGEPVYRLAMIEDISERRRTEAELRLGNEIIANIEEGLCLVRMSDGIIVHSNPKFEKMFGYGPNEMRGKHISAINATGGKTPEAVAQEIIAVLNRDKVWRGEILNRRKDGTPFWCSASVSTLDHPEYGNVWVSIHQDITERRRAEEQIEAQRIQLVSSSRLAALGMMAGGVAHEINNPLTIIHALAEDLLYRVKEDGYVPLEILVQDVDRILQTAKRIAKIIKSMRHLAKDGSHDKPLPAPVARIVDEVLEVCREQFKSHSIELFLPGIDPDLQVCCRETQIAQVLLNLLQNAFDAVMEQPGEKKWVRLGISVRDGSLVLSVTDSGPGVPPKFKTKIMEPFFTTKAAGKGTGLGLSLSRTIVEEHGGELELTEENGHTCFSFRLPLARNAETICN